MKKNSQIHILLETGLKEKLEKEAKENNISISEICRRKLRENSQLNRIEELIKRLQEFD